MRGLPSCCRSARGDPNASAMPVLCSPWSRSPPARTQHPRPGAHHVSVLCRVSPPRLRAQLSSVVDDSPDPSDAAAEPDGYAQHDRVDRDEERRVERVEAAVPIREDGDGGENCCQERSTDRRREEHRDRPRRATRHAHTAPSTDMDKDMAMPPQSRCDAPLIEGSRPHGARCQAMRSLPHQSCQLSAHLMTVRASRSAQSGIRQPAAPATRETSSRSMKSGDKPGNDTTRSKCVRGESTGQTLVVLPRLESNQQPSGYRPPVRRGSRQAGGGGNPLDTAPGGGRRRSRTTVSEG